MEQVLSTLKRKLTSMLVFYFISKPVKNVFTVNISEKAKNALPDSLCMFIL